MKVGVLQVELWIPWSESLKDKRRVVKSLKDTLHREMMVAAAEVGALDSLTHARLGVTCCASSAKRVSTMLDNITRRIETKADARIGSIQRDIFDPAHLASGWTDEDGQPLWTEADRREEAS